VSQQLLTQHERDQLMGGRLKLVASMICRDELDRYQPRLAEHLLSFCDEVRVLDDCSKDQTAYEIERLDPRVRVKAVMGMSTWDAWGEGVARQQLLDWTMEAKPTHVLAIDADEFVPRGTVLRKIVRCNPDAEVFSLRMVEIWKRDAVPWQMRVDGGWAPRDCPILWRVPPTCWQTGELPEGWEIPNRKLASGREPEIVAALGAFGDAIRTGLDVCHLGWSEPYERRPRYERYMELDGGDFHATEHLLSILTPPELEPYPAHPESLSTAS
jgi:hypothetical protein